MILIQIYYCGKESLRRNGVASKSMKESEMQFLGEWAWEQTRMHRREPQSRHPVSPVRLRALGHSLMQLGFLISGKFTWLLWVSVFASRKWQVQERISKAYISSNISWHTSLPSLPWLLAFHLIAARSYFRHVGSSPLTGDGTWAPCVESMES